MKVVAIVQARMGSSRLPGKVLKDICGKPMLWHTINRIQESRSIDKVVVATTINQLDDAVESFCKKNKVAYFRGYENDVLSRYYHAAIKYNADIIVRITGDCPLIDPRVSNKVIKEHLRSGADYTSNVITRLYPRGLDTEVFNFKSLIMAFLKAKKQYEREHVTPYIYENPNIFTLKSVEAVGKLRRPDIRITVDTLEDYRTITEIFSKLHKHDRIFYTEEVIDLLDSDKELMEINKKIRQKSLK